MEGADNAQGFDLPPNISHLIDTGITSYFGAQSTKNLSRSNPANTGIVTIGIIAIAALLIWKLA